MKKAALKSIIKDLNMAGIFDIPANSFMDFDKIENSPIINNAFQNNNNLKKLNIEIIPDENLPSSQDISNEINALFSTFNENKKATDIDNDCDVIELKTIKAKRITPEKTTRVRKSHQNISKNEDSISKEIISPEISLPDPKSFINCKKVKNSKIIIILNFKDENNFNRSEEYNLLKNIIKTLKHNIDESSFIFINNDYKKVTPIDTTYSKKLANELKKEVNSISGGLIFSFGEDCLKLATNNDNTIRKSSNQLLKSFDDKILLANYSLSAMMNTPKYKRITWNNILLFKEKNEDF